MSERWAARMARADGQALGALRTRPGIDVCEAGEELWLRGDRLDDDLDLALRKLPGLQLHAVLPDGCIVARGRRIPSSGLPQGPWVGLREWASLAPQAAALAGKIDRRVGLTLVAGGESCEADVIVTDLARWAAWAAGAPAIRLGLLRFALAADGRVVAWGNPLPPIAGRRYNCREGVAAPCGYEWRPKVDAEVLRALFGLEAGDLVLLEPDGTFEQVSAGAFARATRSAVRLSAREAAHG